MRQIHARLLPQFHRIRSVVEPTIRRAARVFAAWMDFAEAHSPVPKDVSSPAPLPIVHQMIIAVANAVQMVEYVSNKGVLNARKNFTEKLGL